MQEVEFVHVDSGNWDVLKRKLEVAIIKADLDVILLESLEDDQGLTTGRNTELKAKIRLGSDRVFQRAGFPDDEAFIKKVVNEMRIQKRSMASEILVPMDFSAASINAFKYALSLARYTQSSLRVLHFLAPSHDPNLDGVTYFNNDFETERRRQWQDFVQDLKNRYEADIADLPNRINDEFLIGKAKDLLIDLSKRSTTRMIVLGSTGAGKILKSLFGSVSTYVAIHAACPTVVVPADAIFEAPRKILLAIDWSNPEPTLIKGIRRIIGAQSARIQAVQVYTQSNAYTEENVELSCIDEYKQVEELVLFKKNIVEGLNDFALQHQIDLIAVVRKQRPFFQRLFHHSVSHNLAANSAIPLMVLHEDEFGHDILRK